MKNAKEILKIVALAAGAMIAIGLIGNAAWIYFTGRELEGRLAALRANGQPLSIADLARKPFPPEENAVTYLRRAKEQVDGAEQLQEYEYTHDHLLDEKEARAVQAAFEAYPRGVPLLEQAAACPDYDSQLDCTLAAEPFVDEIISKMQYARACARVLDLHCQLLAAQGNRDEALQDSITQLRLARHLARSPAIVSYLVSIAFRELAVAEANLVLQSGAVSATSREAIDRELEIQDTAEPFRRCLQTERAFGLSAQQSLLPGSNHWLSRALVNREAIYYLDYMDQEISAADAPSWKYRRPVPKTTHVVISEILPPMQSTRSAETRSRAHLRCVRVLNALQALPPDRQAAVPKLSELNLPPDAILDPYNGKEILCKRLPAGWLVYTVGEDRKDGGGDLKETADVGFGPPEAKRTENEDSEN